MQIETMCIGPAQANCYLMWNDARQALVIDPGADALQILSAIRALELSVIAYPLTHGHIDHVSALAAVHAEHPADVGMHPADAEWAFTRKNQMLPWYGPVERPTPIRREYADGQVWDDAGLRYRVLHTPGHSPGGVCFYFESEGVLVAGDCLFAGSIGRVDLPGGDASVLMTTLERLLRLPDDTRVLPGHGPETTLGQERRTNPFLQPLRASDPS